MSEEAKENTWENKCNILSDLWLSYRQEQQFKDFVSYNDLGLPLGFLISEELVTPNELAKQMVEETYSLLLATLEVDDGEYDSIDDLLLG
jgi:hypothetical protein